ncbi:MAG: hypothetical protein ACXW1Z_24405 [Methylobacter sp.]
MSSTPPALIAIDADDYHAEHVGKTSDGCQFFLTTPFEPARVDSEGGEFVALYTFDRSGKLLSADIDSFGPRKTMDESGRKKMYEDRLKSLGNVSLERIEVAPFAVEKFDTTFGLVLRHPEEEDDPWAVEVQPGNYMAFFEPWDSGEYDT